MRREVFRGARERAVALLERAPFVHVAGVDADGAPVARTLHGVVNGNRVCFHAAPVGEKSALVGKPVVVWAEEIVAEIPSTFTDPVRACPATTLYESAQVHGVLTRVDDIDDKARVLQALMRRYQPQGGHAPITADDPRYAAAVRGVAILAVSLDDVDGKRKLAQNKSPEERARLLEKLWQRGAPGDARAVDLVRGAAPGGPPVTPAFLAAPRGFLLRCALDAPGDAARFAGDAAALLDDAYWNVGVGRERIARAHLASSAWVGALDEAGRLAATARALADGAKWATIYDVIVRADVRGRGLGSAVVRLLLEHPALRACTKVALRTRDAQGLYARHGFVERPASQNTEMVLVR